MTTTAEAVNETYAFLAAHQPLSDNREVRVVSSAGAEGFQLSLGTVRALYALAVAAQGMRQKIAEADAAYQAATGER
jgi:hypothetical protein